MKTLLLELEHIVYEKAMPVPYTIMDICFRPLPNVELRPQVREHILEERKKGTRVVLVCYGEEVHVKEVLYALHMFELFDEFWVLDEMAELEQQVCYSDIARLKKGLSHRQ